MRELLLSPLRDGLWRWQMFLAALLYSGLQAAFFPLALALEAGYAMQVARNILLGSGELEMPDVRDWQMILKDGIRHWGVTLIFTLPGILLTVELCLAVGLLSGQGSDTPFVAVVLLMLGLPLALLLVLVGAELALLASMQVLIEGSFAAAFHFKAWWVVLRNSFAEIQRTVLKIAISGLFLWVLALVAVIPASLVCIGPFFVFSAVALYLRVVSVAAIARVFRDGCEELEEDVE